MLQIILASSLILFPMNVIIYMWLDNDYQRGNFDNVYLREIKKKMDPYKFMLFFRKLVFRASFIFMFIGSYLMVRMIL